jgi:hypothetical protein
MQLLQGRTASDRLVLSECRLGKVGQESSFSVRECLYPVGYQAVWSVGDSGSLISSISTMPDTETPTPCFTVAVQLPRSSPFQAAPEPITVATSAKDPDTVWREVFMLQRAALELPQRPDKEHSGSSDGSELPSTDIADRKAALKAAPALLWALQQVELPAIHWGTLLFGFADIRTLQLLEALPDAADAAHYTFAEVRMPILVSVFGEVSNAVHVSAVGLGSLAW